MTYRDNEVSFSLEGGYSLISGSYTVNSFSVTDGQDPEGHICNGEKFTCGNDGKMKFSIGRKGSDDVADWFNNRISSSQNTFDHGAEKLNFAFLGTLKLTIISNIFGGKKETFTFSNISLAQGHSGSSNNWWFGGQTCSYIQNNQVKVKGVNSNGDSVLFVFLRGGNDVSTIGVIPKKIATPEILVDTKNWMCNLKDSIRLDNIMMPGSHDAGLSELHHCAPPKISDGYMQTQSGSIGQQLVDGSRYFDIRVDYDYSDYIYFSTGRFRYRDGDFEQPNLSVYY